MCVTGLSHSSICFGIEPFTAHIKSILPVGIIGILQCLRATSLLLLVLGVVSFFFGVWNSLGTIFIIRKYPKYKKITKWFLNIDYYFIDSDSKEYHGHWRGRAAFNKVNQIAQQNADLYDIKYPKTYGVFIALTIMGIFLIFFNIFGVWLALENVNALPSVLQSEGVIFALFIVFEVFDLILI